MSRRDRHEAHAPSGSKSRYFDLRWPEGAAPRGVSLRELADSKNRSLRQPVTTKD